METLDALHGHLQMVDDAVEGVSSNKLLEQCLPSKSITSKCANCFVMCHLVFALWALWGIQQLSLASHTFLIPTLSHLLLLIHSMEEQKRFCYIALHILRIRTLCYCAPNLEIALGHPEEDLHVPRSKRRWLKSLPLSHELWQILTIPTYYVLLT